MSQAMNIWHNVQEKKIFFNDNNTPKIVQNTRGKTKTPGSKDII